MDLCTQCWLGTWAGALWSTLDTRDVARPLGLSFITFDDLWLPEGDLLRGPPLSSALGRARTQRLFGATLETSIVLLSWATLETSTERRERDSSPFPEERERCKRDSLPFPWDLLSTILCWRP